MSANRGNVHSEPMSTGEWTGGHLADLFAASAAVDLRGEPAPEAVLSPEAMDAYYKDCEPYWRARRAACVCRCQYDSGRGAHRITAIDCPTHGIRRSVTA